MKALKQIFKFYIKGSIHVALSVASLTALTFHRYQIEFDLNLCLLAFFATITSYNFMKYGTAAKRYFVVKDDSLKLIQAVSYVSFLAMCYMALQLRLEVLLWLGFSGVLTLLYALPLLPNNNSFRSLHGLKIYIVALCWAIITVLIPVVDDERTIDLSVILECVARFLLVLALIIPFDIRDLKEDSLSLGTLPQQFGVKKAKQIASVLVMLFLLLFYVSPVLSISLAIEVSLVGLITLLFIFFATENQSEYYCGFWVESIPILWFAINYGFLFL